MKKRKYDRWSMYWIVAVIKLLGAAGMMLAAYIKQDDNAGALCFVLSLVWLFLAGQDIYYYFKDKKAAGG